MSDANPDDLDSGASLWKVVAVCVTLLGVPLISVVAAESVEPQRVEVECDGEKVIPITEPGVYVFEDLRECLTLAHSTQR